MDRQEWNRTISLKKQTLSLTSWAPTNDRGETLATVVNSYSHARAGIQWVAMFLKAYQTQLVIDAYRAYRSACYALDLPIFSFYLVRRTQCDLGW